MLVQVSPRLYQPDAFLNFGVIGFQLGCQGHLGDRPVKSIIRFSYARTDAVDPFGLLVEPVITEFIKYIKYEEQTASYTDS